MTSWDTFGLAGDMPIVALEPRRPDRLTSGSGLFSAAEDGTGPRGAELVRANPGPPPVTTPPMPRGADPGLMLAMDRGEYTLRVRWYTELGDDACFARWLLLPATA
jgi:hypothetical protein